MALHVEKAQELVWSLIEQNPSRRPRVADLARELHTTSTALRRMQRRNRAAKLQDLITFGCISYAAETICNGGKIFAAMRIAGFRNKTNFNKQFYAFLGMTPSQYRLARRPLHCRSVHVTASEPAPTYPNSFRR